MSSTVLQTSIWILNDWLCNLGLGLLLTCTSDDHLHDHSTLIHTCFILNTAEVEEFVQ
jgi:hypothetical protein